ncbi:SigE family RNA polymerase sigma factor [Micromonospora sp. M12]
MTRFAYLLTGDRHHAEDLVQVALARVAVRWERIEDPPAYLRRVLCTQAASWWRWRRARPSERLGALLPERSGPGDDVDLRLVLSAALARLTVRQRAVLVLRYYEDRTETETAALLGCRVGTVKSQTRHALARLRVLAPSWPSLSAVARRRWPSDRPALRDAAPPRRRRAARARTGGLFDAARTRHRRRRAVAAGALAVLVLLLGTGYALHPVALLLPAGPRHDALACPPDSSTRRCGPPRSATRHPAWRRCSSVVPPCAPTGSRPGWVWWPPTTTATAYWTAIRPWRVSRQRSPRTAGTSGWAIPPRPDVRKDHPDRTSGYPLAFAPNGERLVYADDDVAFTSPNTYSTPYVGVYDRERGATCCGCGSASPGFRRDAQPHSRRMAASWPSRSATRSGSPGSPTRVPTGSPRRTGSCRWPAGGSPGPGRGCRTLVRWPSWTDPPAPTARCRPSGAPGHCRCGPRPTAHRWPVRRSAAALPLVRATARLALGGRGGRVGRCAGSGGGRRPGGPRHRLGPYHEMGTEAVELVVLRRGAPTPEVLFRTPKGITDLSVAADLAIRGAMRESGRPHYGPPPFWALAVGFVLAVLVALPVLGWLRRWRDRRLHRGVRNG